MMNLYSKGLTLINAEESPISKLKADTQLYRLTRGNDFSDMALDNSFRYDDRRVTPEAGPGGEIDAACDPAARIHSYSEGRR